MSKVDHLNKVIPDDKLADNFHADQTSQTLFLIWDNSALFFN